MILKEDDQSTVTQDGELIIKTFKPNHKFYIDDYEEWKNTCNHFSEAYGHFPKIIECDIDKIIMEKINGKTIENLVRDSREMSFKEVLHLTKKIQYMYFKFISNLLEYNVNNDTMLSHSDLNYNNMYVANDKLVCIDLDAVKLNRFPVETTFISLPLTVFQLDAESLNYHYTGQMHMDKGKHEN